MAYKLMSNVNKVASFSRPRNEDMTSDILSRKGREIPHPLRLHGEIEKLFVLLDSAWEIEKIVARGRIRTWDLSGVRRRQCARFSRLSYPTQLTAPEKCLYDSQSIVSALS